VYICHQFICKIENFSDEIQLGKLTNGVEAKKEKNEFSSKLQSELSRIRRPNLKKFVFQHFPIFEWLPKYNLDDGISDLIAGITVGLTIIPQGIAYALVANLPAQVSFIYFFEKLSCMDDFSILRHIMSAKLSI